MKTLFVTVGLVALLASSALAQEVVITGFPMGIGATVDQEIFAPYQAELQTLADVLEAHPEAHAVIVGQADGSRYATASDAKNPGLSLGRSHALRNMLVSEYGVDSTQLLIQSNEVPAKGDQYRSVSVRVVRPPDEPKPFGEPVAVVTPVVQPAEVVQNITNYYEQMTLRLSGGITSSPFGAMPAVTGAVTWSHTVSLEIALGHTFWNDSFSFEGAKLRTWRRMLGGRLNITPWHNKSVGIVAGWTRIEEIAQSPYEFVRLSEGPVMGISVIPLHNVSLVGLFNPARHRIAGAASSVGKGGQFLLSLSVFTDFGGDQ